MNHDSLTQIVMVCRSLSDIPVCPLAPPFSLRAYRPGDEAAWVQIERLADRHNDIDEAVFAREFGGDESQLRQRQLFMCAEDGSEIGTATAWKNEHYAGEPYGRVHWVAIVPHFQGRGLARPLLSACLDRMKELGCRGAYLTTEPPRIAAIGLYLKFGFVPGVRCEAEREAWRILAGQVSSKYRGVIESAL